MYYNHPKDGFYIEESKDRQIVIRHYIKEVRINKKSIDGCDGDVIGINNMTLPSEAGTPNLPASSRYITIPKDCSNFDFEIYYNDSTIFSDIDILPASSLKLDTESDEITVYKDSSIYKNDIFYPDKLLEISKPVSIRGLDLILLSVTPFRYNPVKHQLKVYHDISIKLHFNNGKNYCLEDRFRSREWDNILKNMILNYNIIDEYDYDKRNNLRAKGLLKGCDYLIITADDEEMISYADTLRRFREEQGIATEVINIDDIGNHPDSIRQFLKNIYDNYDIVPSAVLILGDYPAGSGIGVTTFAMDDHPGGMQYEPYLTDNRLTDFNNDGLPEIAVARMPAADGNEAAGMIYKVINYERHPYDDASYYDSPVTAMGYEESRWFQLCSEVVNGFFSGIGKHPRRINAIHSGTPSDVWSTGQNTETVVQYFGPEGCGYIPSTMAHLEDWNGSSQDITNAIQEGTFIIQHRDHGTFKTWGEPYYSTDLIRQLDNERLTFVMSANCMTGDFGFGYGDDDCFAERFMRSEHGAVAVIGASQASYSYVNDTYVWGFYDNLWNGFLPDYGNEQSDFQRPAFANVAGKYYLNQSSWPYNHSFKRITYQLFHYFGDAYFQLFSEKPKYLTVSHNDSIPYGVYSTAIKADHEAGIALSVDGNLIATARGTGDYNTVVFTAQPAGSVIKVTVTKQNHYRHESYIHVMEDPYSDIQDSNNTSIFPNPADNNITVKGNFEDIKITNSMGQTTFHCTINDNSLTIDCSQWADGIYILLARQTDGKIISKKFIIQ